MTMYFYYTKTTTSRWSPVKSVEKPSLKRSDGSQSRPFTQIVKLPPTHVDLPLYRLRTLYPVGDL